MVEETHAGACEFVGRGNNLIMFYLHVVRL